MTSPSTRIAFLSVLLGALLSSISVYAQNEIVENPQGAVKLQRIWYKLGKGIVDERVGGAAGSVQDVNGNKYDDFVVRTGVKSELFLGSFPAPANSSVWSADSLMFFTRGPVVGDFLGTGEKMIVMDHSQCNEQLCRITFRFYVSDQNDFLRLTQYALHTDDQQFCNPAGVLAYDLDKDGADELIVASWCYYPKVWIYRGGLGFDVSAPTLIIIDSSHPELKGEPMTISIGRSDADEFPDMVIGQSNRPSQGINPELRFWWGDEGSPWNWTDQPDRVVEMPPGTITPSYNLVSQFRDYDGDSVMDFTGRVSLGDTAGVYLWLSHAENTRTRSFNGLDYDDFFAGYGSAGSFGYVADTGKRYQMLGLRPDPGPDRAIGLAGGPSGPNHTYDAYVEGGDGPAGGGVSAGDVNGDGWEDRIIASETYGGPGVGAAAIIAGGPYIPNDDSSLSVREEPVAGESGGLYLWPNPVADELHIAWKGNLKRMPARLTIHDVGGRLVVEGPVNPWRGEALWRCADVPAGVYLLTVYDTNGEAVATANVIKQ